MLVHLVRVSLTINVCLSVLSLITSTFGGEHSTVVLVVIVINHATVCFAVVLDVNSSFAVFGSLVQMPFLCILPVQWGDAVQQRWAAPRCVTHVKPADSLQSRWGNICDYAMSCSGQGVDTVLSETGIQQCEAVGRYFRDTKFSNVFVSDLQRTIEVR